MYPVMNSTYSGTQQQMQPQWNAFGNTASMYPGGCLSFFFFKQCIF